MVCVRYCVRSGLFEANFPVENTGGEGGIRTLGNLLSYDALAKRCFRPLSHLSGFYSFYQTR